MQQAAVAPETLTENPPETLAVASVPEIVPGQRHPRSLKVDARRVNANQGAIVSVEGQLNPPPESILPQLPLAPPAAEPISELPPLEVAMTEPVALPLPSPPPLPPPNSVATPAEPQFLYAETPTIPPPTDPVKNVQWKDAEPAETKEAPWKSWGFPLAGLVGGLLIGLLLWRRK